MNRSHFLALLVLIACGNPGDSGPTPAWAEGQAWLIDESPSLRLGSVDGDPTLHFVDVTAVIFLTQDRIAVADNGVGSVRVFTAAGQLEFGFGSKGQGPGEFARLSTVARYRADSLVTIDAPRRAVSVWSDSGELGRTFLLPVNNLPQAPVALTDGRLVVVERSPRGASTGVSGQLLDSVRPLVVSPDGARSGSLPLVPYQYLQVIGRSVWPAFLKPQASFAAGSDRVFWAWPERFEVTVLPMSGDPPSKFTRPYQRVPITNALRDSLTNDLVRTSYRGPLSLSDMADTVRAAMGGDSLPAYSSAPLHSLRADPEGNVWVPSYAFGLATPIEWTVFSSDGVWLGEVAAPPGLRILDIGRDRMVGVARDDLDVQYIQVHRIRKPPTR